MKIRLLTCVVVALIGSRCGSDAFRSCSCSQAEPREKDWSKEVVFEKEPPWPPEPPEVYRGPWHEKSEEPQALVKAEEEFTKKNYETAMEGYRKFIQKHPESHFVPHATFQISRCHHQRSEYDEALQTMEKFIEDRPGTLWEARARVKMASLYWALPTYGFELDDRIYYNYENREGQQRWLGQENKEKAVSLLEDARLAYVSLVQAPADQSGKEKGEDLRLEAVDTDFLLIRDIDQVLWDKGDHCPPAEPIDPPDPSGLYDPHWSPRQKLLYLYEDVASFNQSRKDTHPEAWARLKKALYLMRYPECAPAQWLTKVQKERESFEEQARRKWEEHTGRSSDDVQLRYILDDLGMPDFQADRWEPGPDLDPLSILDSVIEEFPHDEHIHMYRATRGRILEGRGEFVEAEEAYEQFIESYPESPWVPDVQSSLTSLRRPTLSLASDQELSYPGQDGRVGINTRNVDQVQLDVYRVDLVKLMLSKNVLRDPYTRLMDVGSFWNGYDQARKSLKKKVWSTTFETGDTHQHRHLAGSVILPDDLPLGTYMVHAHTKDLDVIWPLIKTDLVIVGKAVKDEMRYLVTDAITGAPVPDVSITVKEVYEKSWNWETLVRTAAGQSDKQGRFTHKLLQGNDIHGNRVQVLARRGDSIALTGSISAPYHHSSETGMTYRIFTVTDRPVYRPGDTVKFKHAIRTYQDGKNVNPGKLSVHLTVRGPDWDNILDETRKTTSFGTVWAEVRIPEDAALGVYTAQAQVKNHEWRSYQSSGSTFRVEEYKKPEFRVQVLPSEQIARPGDDVKARVEATYYFGAPVANAEVSYKIYRSPFMHSYSPPNRWDWLYGQGFGIVHEHSFTPGEDLVADGQGRTDDLGQLLVDLPPVSAEDEMDYTYKVVAEVTDPSRRVISGEGTLKVTRDPYYTYIVPSQGFYTAGDRVEVEIRALTADDEPVEASGTLEVVRLVHVDGKKPQEKPVHSKKLSLDERGRGFQKFKAGEAGQYRVTFTSTHDGSDQVVGQKIVNVAGATMTRKHFRFDGVEVSSEKRTYLRGETISLLVQSPWEDASLWVTCEGGDEVFEDRILSPDGMGAVLEMEATEQLHPNFFVRVTAVHDGMVHTVKREIFIPPGEEILDVSIALDRDEYEPRSKGKVHIDVKDHEGNPLEGEFSLSVFDSSVLYIQDETAGDIRSYYYGQRRHHDIQEFHSTQIWMYGYSRDTTSYPYLATMGLPTSGGYFQEPYVDRGLYYSCPSCETKRQSPWRYGLPGNKKQTVITGSSGPGTIGLGNIGTIGHGGGGGTGTGYGRGSGSLEGGAKTTKAPSKKRRMKMEEGGILGSLATAEESPDMAAAMDSLKSNDREGTPPGSQDFVRENFADTALWVPDVVTDDQGHATEAVSWPDNLTTWAVRIFGVDGTSRVGLARAEVITTKKLVARVETPRFMMEGDEITLAAVVNNDHADEKRVKLELRVTGSAQVQGRSRASVTVQPGKDARHDFRILAMQPGEVTVTLSARTDDDSDAVRRKLEVMEWGSDRMVTRAGAMRAPGSMTLDLEIPAERRKETTQFVLTMDPTVATVVLKSMPYLIHYPYGCVEQTMSRFLPAAMVARTLKDMGISLSDIPKLADSATLADPVGRAHGAPQAWWNQPVYSDRKLDAIIKKGLRRIYAFQHGDGGWGWWQGGRSDEYMTAYVVSGLVVAQDAGYQIDSYVIDRGMHFLGRRYEKEKNSIVKKTGWENLDASTRHHMAYLAYVLSLKDMVRMEDVQGLWDHRESLTHQGRALLALTMYNIDEPQKADLAIENLKNVAWKNQKNRTASFKFENKQYWRWYNSRTETVAWALRAFTTIDPSHELGPMFARWLVNNREGNRWFSTKDTALALLSLTEYMTAHQELDPDYDVTVTVNGKEHLSYHVGKDDIFKGKGTIVLTGDEVQGDELHVTISTQGKGALYASAFLSYFTREATILASGNDIDVTRHYYRLHEVKKKVKTWYGEVTRVKYAREELSPGDEIESGDLIEVKIVVNSANDYEYLVFEDFKPAGCEPTLLKSGGIFEHGTWMNREMRDEKVVTFISSLPQGKQVITYTMRAEIPGEFRVLPHNAYAMYAPRVKAISDSWHLTIAP